MEQVRVEYNVEDRGPFCTDEHLCLECNQRQELASRERRLECEEEQDSGAPGLPWGTWILNAEIEMAKGPCAVCFSIERRDPLSGELFIRRFQVDVAGMA